MVLRREERQKRDGLGSLVSTLNGENRGTRAEYHRLR